MFERENSIIGSLYTPTKLEQGESAHFIDQLELSFDL